MECKERDREKMAGRGRETESGREKNTEYRILNATEEDRRRTKCKKTQKEAMICKRDSLKMLSA